MSVQQKTRIRDRRLTWLGRAGEDAGEAGGAVKLANLSHNNSMGSVAPAERFFQACLLGMVASGYLAVAATGYLDPISLGVAGFALVFRALVVAGVFKARIPAGAVAVATLLYVAFYPLDWLLISKSFITATIRLVFFLASVKVLTAVTPRDYFFVKIAALLELLAACVLSSHVSFFLFLALFVVFTIATFTGSEIRSAAMRDAVVVRTYSRLLPRQLGAVAMCLSVGILAITAALFFVLPRTARMALQHIVPPRYHLAGFSDEVSLGEIGEIKQRNTPVMHVVTQDGRPLPAGLRWRGAALSEFDGRRWFNPRGGNMEIAVHHWGAFLVANDAQRSRPGTRIDYVVRLNEDDGGVLFTTGLPEWLHLDEPGFIRASSAGCFRLEAARGGPVVYQVQSFIGDGHAITRGANEFPPEPGSPYLQLPPLDPRIDALTRQITAGIAAPYGEARAIEMYLRTHFGYTLQLPAREPQHPIAEFLFGRKKGHCEYFASAMAVMLRQIGIPSRVVTGFQSGVYNPFTHQQLIRSSDAHSWVEAYLNGNGWTTFDPTPVIAGPPEASFSSVMSLYLDAAEVFWQQWVLDYNFDRQILLAARMQESSRKIRTNWLEDWNSSFKRYGDIAIGAARRDGLLALLVGVVLALIWTALPRLRVWIVTRNRTRRVRSGKPAKSDAAVLYARMLDLLKRRGIEKPAWQTPTEFARVVRDPWLARLVDDFTAAYNDFRFGGSTERGAAMLDCLGRLEAGRQDS